MHIQSQMLLEDTQYFQYCNVTNLPLGGGQDDRMDGWAPPILYSGNWRPRFGVPLVRVWVRPVLCLSLIHI